MYSEKMSKAVSAAQNCIDLCCGEGSVSMTSAAYIDALIKYLDILDPSGVDFSKSSFFNNIKIKNYWNDFSRYYPSVEGILDKLQQNCRIVSNTLKTLRSEYDGFTKEYESFVNGDHETGDAEYIQQSAVAGNLKVIFENTVTEHEALQKKLSEISAIAAQVFANAVLIARTDYKINISSGLSASAAADPDEYRRGFSRLNSLCR